MWPDGWASNQVRSLTGWENRASTVTTRFAAALMGVSENWMPEGGSTPWIRQLWMAVAIGAKWGWPGQRSVCLPS